MNLIKGSLFNAPPGHGNVQVLIIVSDGVPGAKPGEPVVAGFVPPVVLLGTCKPKDKKGS